MPNEIQKIAIPVIDHQLSTHLGQCSQFVFFSVDTMEKQVLDQEHVEAPPHQPGMLPHWLHEQGVTVLIGGGMGRRAIQLFAQLGIEMFIGVAVDRPENIVQNYLNNTLVRGENLCDH